MILGVSIFQLKLFIVYKKHLTRENELLIINRKKHLLLLNLKFLKLKDQRNKYKKIIQKIDQLRYEEYDLETQGSIYEEQWQ